MNSDVIMISTDRMIETASSEVEQDRRQREDEHRQDAITPIASSRSERRASAPISPIEGSASPPAAPLGPARRRANGPAFADAIAAGAMPTADPTVTATTAPSFVTPHPEQRRP